MTLTDLERLARAAITDEPSDHGKLSSTKMQVWQDALDDFHDEAHPERVLQLIAIVRAADALRNDCDEYWSSDFIAAYDAARAQLEALP
jgi:hypothetical protein